MIPEHRSSPPAAKKPLLVVDALKLKPLELMALDEAGYDVWGPIRAYQIPPPLVKP